MMDKNYENGNKQRCLAPTKEENDSTGAILWAQIFSLLDRILKEHYKYVQRTK